MNDFLVNCRNIFVPFYDCSTENGIDNAIRLGYSLQDIIAEHNIYERYVGPRSICYDIGAYVGTHSILFALLGAQVYSFEPSPFNYPRLKQNCLPFNQIKTFDIAFHEKEYDIVTKFKDCTSAQHNAGREQLIKYRIFDKFIKDNNLCFPDFMKVDIEGMETVLLKTLRDILKKNKTVIYVELHPKPLEMMDLNRYDDNPNWLFINEGGYDFNELKDYNLRYYKSISNKDFEEIDKSYDFNTLDGALVLVPK